MYTTLITARTHFRHSGAGSLAFRYPNNTFIFASVPNLVFRTHNSPRPRFNICIKMQIILMNFVPGLQSNIADLYGTNGCLTKIKPLCDRKVWHCAGVAWFWWTVGGGCGGIHTSLIIRRMRPDCWMLGNGEHKHWRLYHVQGAKLKHSAADKIGYTQIGFAKKAFRLPHEACIFIF